VGAAPGVQRAGGPPAGRGGGAAGAQDGERAGKGEGGRGAAGAPPRLGRRLLARTRISLSPSHSQRGLLKRRTGLAVALEQGNRRARASRSLGRQINLPNQAGQLHVGGPAPRAPQRARVAAADAAPTATPSLPARMPARRLEDIALTTAAAHVGRCALAVGAGPACAARRVLAPQGGGAAAARCRRDAHSRAGHRAGHGGRLAALAWSAGGLPPRAAAWPPSRPPARRPAERAHVARTTHTTPIHHSRSYRTLTHLPPPLLVPLLDAVLDAGRLTPASLARFIATGDPGVVSRVKALRLDLPPPVVPDSHRPWLGEPPGWAR